MILKSLKINEAYVNLLPTQVGDLGQINYIVGPNSAGKSSFLNFLVDYFKNPKKYNAEPIFYFEIPNNSIATHKIDLGSTSYISTGHPGDRFGTDEQLNNLNHVRDSILKENKIEVIPRKMAGASAFTSEYVTKKVVDKQLKDLKIDPQLLSSGQRSLARLLTHIKGINLGKHTIYLIDEPETSLHPTIQKQIPSILNNLFEEKSKEDNKIQFFITTHSPFIINAARTFPGQKIYRFEEGACLHENGTMGDLMMKDIAQMLGADPTDIGLPNFLCLTEESSLCGILNICKDKNFLKDFYFISCGGYPRITNFPQRLENLEVQRTLFICNPLYAETFFIITDSIPEDQKKDGRYKKLKKLNDRYFELSKKDIEDYYESFDNDIYKTYKITQKELLEKGEGDGELKNKTAIEIAQKISSKEDFSKLFNNELDFLLKV